MEKLKYSEIHIEMLKKQVVKIQPGISWLDFIKLIYLYLIKFTIADSLQIMSYTSRPYLMRAYALCIQTIHDACICFMHPDHT